MYKAVRPGRLCFQKIISLQNQRITAEYQDWNWLAQVSIVQARDSWFSSDDVKVDQITPKLHKKTAERQRTTPVFTGIQVLLVLGVLLFQFYFQYNLFILRLEPPGTRLAQQAPTYGSLQRQLLVFTVTLSKEQQQRKTCNRLLQNLGNKRRCIFKDPHQDSGWCNFSCAKYSENVLPKCIARTFYGDAMLVSLWEAPTWLPETTRNISYQFCNESVNLYLEELTQSKDCPQNKLLFLTYMTNSSLGRHMNAVRNSSVLYHKRGPVRGLRGVGGGGGGVVLCRPSEF